VALFGAAGDAAVADRLGCADALAVLVEVGPAVGADEPAPLAPWPQAATSASVRVAQTPHGAASDKALQDKAP
ncbi:hypothetical protein KGA66_26070, partial [Actinocrinis puniceicyclus]